MGMDYDAFYNLAERIEDAFSEIDSDVCTYLRGYDDEYKKMSSEIAKLQEIFPVIPRIMEGDGDGPVSLSAEEHAALVQYLELKNDMENAERKHLYFRGHTDNFAYLKRIGVI
jgi:hypothetical protein